MVLLFRDGVRYGVMKMPSICNRIRISPQTAQTLARHSDIRLTMNVYTHTELAEQTAAIAALPGPPARKLREVAG